MERKTQLEPLSTARKKKDLFIAIAGATQARFLFRDQAFETMHAQVKTVVRSFENEIPEIGLWSGKVDPEDIPVETSYPHYPL
jgi:hypothetical protein